MKENLPLFLAASFIAAVLAAAIALGTQYEGPDAINEEQAEHQLEIDEEDGHVEIITPGPEHETSEEEITH